MMADAGTQDGTHIPFVSPIGYMFGHCGYCGERPDAAEPAGSDEESDGPSAASIVNKIKAKKSGSYYVFSTNMPTGFYNAMIESGWRRGGNLFYLPDAANSCCPHYPLRLDAAEFKPAREFRQAIHRWNRFVLGPEYEAALAKTTGRAHKPAKGQNAEFDLAAAVHRAERDRLPDDKTVGCSPAHDFAVNIEPAEYTTEKSDLFYRYQRGIHNEPERLSRPVNARRVLCDSPLGPGPTDRTADDKPGKLLGTFHLCFRLDGKLVALSVLDLLPSGVSSVYHIYDAGNADLAGHSFGKISILFEIDLAVREGYRNNYLGYMIWSCPKMRYKAAVSPQLVLDWFTRTWVPLDSPFVRSQFEKAGKNIASLAVDEEIGEEDDVEVQDVGSIENGIEKRADKTDSPLSFMLPVFRPSAGPTTGSGLFKSDYHRAVLQTMIDKQAASIFTLPVFPGAMTAIETAQAVDLTRITYRLRRPVYVPIKPHLLESYEECEKTRADKVPASTGCCGGCGEDDAEKVDESECVATPLCTDYVRREAGVTDQTFQLSQLRRWHDPFQFGEPKEKPTEQDDTDDDCGRRDPVVYGLSKPLSPFAPTVLEWKALEEDWKSSIIGHSGQCGRQALRSRASQGMDDYGVEHCHGADEDDRRMKRAVHTAAWLMGSPDTLNSLLGDMVGLLGKDAAERLADGQVSIAF